MKKFGCFFSVMVFIICFSAVPALCVPLDLSGFMGDATESGGTISFVDDNFQQYYAYSNSSFTVAGDAGILSFNYSLDLEPDDTWDYLTLEIDFSPVITMSTQGSGYQEFDLSAYQGQTIDLAWVLWWGGDMGALGSSATVSNIDLAAANVAPVPEPATILLIATGMCGLPFIKRKKS
ncbi:PEP-CTERM sorting domain-containing protein [Desulfosarcina ovata]|uniref:Uncharacterized protein n=1 Tax=Desulfosarcina ovata subsp. ovata TaxID=2752305 RepID=A0A5K8A4S2_9BACT|nr:PEP-CTERM sorting domain-containing protein [Desulfosarcina ovata]BBO87542.1 hypothetical protein DSCOOX_07220 [Desulfosarcina ovata subsp. ovata]